MLLKNGMFIVLVVSFLLLPALFAANILIPGKKEQLKKNLETGSAFSISQKDYDTIKLNESQTCIVNAYSTDLGTPSDLIGYQNNKFGIYIYAEEDYVELAGDLVNSNGGDWGYVLIPINVKDYDGTKWKRIFALLNKKHLIPILQLWDLSKEDEDGQIKESARFLNSLDWPIEKRYISVFNEPNDSKFWRGKADPADYAKVLDETISIFKKENPNFFMLNGAFNASANTGEGYIDEAAFLLQMDKAVPGIFTKLDGWASHPYPQPNFSGSVYDAGRNSIRAYEWELNLLNLYFGVRDRPVFITETGWAHSEGGTTDPTYLDKFKTAQNYASAFTKVWLKDPKVVAVTPFTIRYSPPYDHFSWVDKGEKFYPQYKAVQNLNKVTGKPPYLYKKEVVCN